MSSFKEIAVWHFPSITCKWSWDEEQEKAFQRLKEALISAPVLACPDFTRRFVLQTDASSYGLGAVLTQHQEGGERVIAYASRTLNNGEKNYSATELECLAVVWGIQKMRGYLEGYAFTVVTDLLASEARGTIKTSREKAFRTTTIRFRCPVS